MEGSILTVDNVAVIGISDNHSYIINGVQAFATLHPTATKKLLHEASPKSSICFTRAQILQIKGASRILL